MIVDPAIVGAHMQDIKCIYQNHALLCGVEGVNLDESIFPTVFYCEGNVEIINTVLDMFKERAWGIFLASPFDIKEVVFNLKKWVLINFNNNTYYFRFYDPRVFKEFICNLTYEKIRDFFGNIIFFATNEMGGLMKIYRLESKMISNELISVASFNGRYFQVT